MSQETFFITGFPGFIADRLLERLASSGSNFVLLVQPALLERALTKLTEIAQASGRAVTDFKIVHGDISLPGLGLSATDAELLRNTVPRSLHLAAIYDLAVNRDLA